MRVVWVRLSVPLTVLLASLVVGPDLAVAAVPRGEISFAGGAARSTFETTYDHRFSPVIEYQPEATGAASQALDLEGRDGAAWQLGVRRDLGRRVGGEILLGAAGFELEGSSSPLGIGMEYVSLQPPDYVPVTVAFTSSTAWADPEGDLDLSYLCLNAVVRTRGGERLRLGLSGGVTLFRAEADFWSLGYQTFWMGGHGVLFSETYELRLESEKAEGIGGNLGFDLDIRVSDRVGAFVEVRTFILPAVDTRVAPTEVLNETDVVRELPLAEVASRLDLARLEIDPSFTSLLIGARVSL